MKGGCPDSERASSASGAPRRENFRRGAPPGLDAPIEARDPPALRSGRPPEARALGLGQSDQWSEAQTSQDAL